MFLQTHLTFGKEFTEAVEMKQVAQQEAERARFIVEKVFVLFYNTQVIPILLVHSEMRDKVSMGERVDGLLQLMWIKAAHKIFLSF